VKILKTSAVRRTATAITAFILCGACALAQDATSSASNPDHDSMAAVRSLQEQVQQLRALVDQMRNENAQSRAEMQELRRDLRSTRAMLEHAPASQPAESASTSPAPYGLDSGSSAPSAAPPSAGAQSNLGLEQRVERLEESTSLQGSRIEEQYQTKVETASKYRARLSGIVLLNAFRNVGGSNSLDFPDFAKPVAPTASQATLGATMRQSQIGLEIFGPTMGGVKTSANIQFDFAGGFPATGNAVNFGFMRLQTASLRFDWEHTSVVAGQDSLFLSPLSPTSFASLSVPTFGYAGNLWGWTPQIRIERRFALSGQQTLTLQGGVLDNLDWEYSVDPFYRSAQAGEQSGQPGYGFRTAWSRPAHDHVLSFGVAAYYGRQNWTWDRYVDAWAGMADWQIPILRRLTLSGEFYRGRAIGGFGAGVGRAVVFGGDPTLGSTPIRGLNATGGWSQLKLQLTPKLELNGVFSEDNSLAGDVRGFATDTNNFGAILGRNRGMLGNIVYRPKSDLLFSAELRRLHSFPVYSDSVVSNQVNLAVGILF